MAPLKVLVVGGGIAGPSVAYWLSRLNADITLIERFPRIRAQGQQVDLRAQGVPMMKKMGIEAAVRSASVSEPGMQLIDQNGRTKAYFPMAQTNSGKQGMTSEFEIMRGNLINILYRLTTNRQNVRHVFDTSIENFTQDKEKVHVSFSNGQKENFDLVVGADGIGSRTRKIMLGPDAPDPRHPLGGHIGFFSIPSKPEDTNKWTLCNLPGRRIIGTRQDRPDLLRIYMIIHGDFPTLESAYKSGNLTELKQAWFDLYKDGGWECERFMHDLLHTPEADDLYGSRLDEIRLPEGGWSKGRVVLVGDAAHCQTVGGLGATLGLVGAYMLAGEIAKVAGNGGTTGAVAQAAQRYEEKLRPLVTMVQTGDSWGTSLMLPQSNFGIKIFHLVARVMSAFSFSQPSPISEKAASWPVPEYPELEKEQI